MSRELFCCRDSDKTRRQRAQKSEGLNPSRPGYFETRSSQGIGLDVPGPLENDEKRHFWLQARSASKGAAASGRAMLLEKQFGEGADTVVLSVVALAYFVQQLAKVRPGGARAAGRPPYSRSYNHQPTVAQLSF